MTKSRGMTMIELMVGVVILTVLVSLAAAGYQRYQDRAAMLVDETNQKVLQAAVKLYAYDTNALPGTLSELRSSDLRRAYALVTEEKRPYTLLAYLQEQVGMFDIAEAAPLPGKYYNNDGHVLICPMDRRPGAVVSYGLAPGWGNRSLSALLDPANANSTLIFETNDGITPVFRHGGGTLTVETSVQGKQSIVTP